MPVTVTELTQFAPLASDPFVSVMTLPLTASVPPPQLAVEEFGAEMPAGKVSVKLSPVNEPGLLAGFVIVMLSTEV